MYELIIFDVDGTFYDLDDVVRDNYDMQVDFYARQKGLSVEDVKSLFEENGILPYRSQQARSATEYFLRNGIEAEAWRTYREAHTSVRSIRKETAVSNELLKRYSEQARLVLLSSNSLKNIQSTLEWLEIDEGLFEDVFCSSANAGSGPFSKMEVLPRILAKYGVKPTAALCIGDRYESDIRPLVELGGDGALIETPAGLEEIFRDLSEGVLGAKTNRAYKYFGQKTGREERGK